MKKMYIQKLTLIMAAMLSGTTVMAEGETPTGVVVHGNVYGGGNKADVKVNTTVNICAKYDDDTHEYVAVSDEDAAVTIEGNVYGGGKGEADEFTCAKAMVGVDGEGLTNSNGGTTVRIGNGTIGAFVQIENEETHQTELKLSGGNVYGGGEIGRVEKNTKVIIGIGNNDSSNPIIRGNVFGAGAGLETHGYSALVRGNSEVTVQAGAVVDGSVYGGGEIATVGRYILINGYPIEPNGGGICTVEIKDNAAIAGNVVGAGKGVKPSDYSSSQHVIPSGTSVGFDSQTAYFTFLETLALASETHVTIGGVTANKTATVNGNVYGGSESGFLQRHTQVKILDHCTVGTLSANGNVYGGGKGLEGFADAGRVSGYTSVTISGGTMYGSVYGGGELGYTKGGATVNMTGGTVETGDVYGGGALADTNIGNGTEYVAVPGLTTGASVTGLSEITYQATSDGTALDGKIYYESSAGVYVVKNGLKAGESSVSGLYEIKYQLTEDPKAAIGKTYYEVYVDNESVSHPGVYVVKHGLTAGESSVSGLYEIKYQTTGNETAVANKSYYTITHPTNVNLLGGTIGGDAYGGGLGRLYKAAVQAQAAQGEEGQEDYVPAVAAQDPVSAVEAIVYGDVKLNLNGVSVDEYNSNSTFFSSYLSPVDLVPDVAPAIDYYMVKTTDTKGCIVNRVFGCNNLNGTPKGNVTVHVYATQNKDASKTTVGAKFNKADYSAYTISNYSGLVSIADGLGINIDDNKTILKDEDASEDAKKTALSNIVTAIEAVVSNKRYDLKAVYGGGNEAAYIPMAAYHPDNEPTGSKSQVIIEGCDYTSIETVYGGGNAAPVPEANVTIHSDYEIETVFGGGNGKDAKESDGSANEGADIGTLDHGTNTYGTGNANTMITGGYIHEAYGGSNERGTITGTVNLKSEADGICSMVVGKMVTAGKNADIMGDAITILGCMPNSWVEEYYGGADNANVHGNVELTITSGNFRKVFGGNNKSGIIMGHIKVNIEETGCIPINIDELYLGGNEAAYSTYGYYLEKNNNDEPVLTGGKLTFKPRESETDTHLAVTSFTGTTYTEKAKEEGVEYKFKYDVQPELNVISCTRIGEVFGGGLGETAIVYGNPTVNINMEPGAWANQIDRVAPSGADNNANALGEIGDVYGGGNAAAVYGNTTVNIGTATKVQMTSIKDNDGNLLVTQPEHDVTGAYITGNVYGGGKLADVGAYDEVYDEATDRTNNVINVSGNTNVNICAKLNSSGEWESVAEGTSGVLISGNVYGGGKGANTTDATAIDFYCKDAMVLGNKDDSDGGTFVHIGNGTVNGNVYGGGEISRVEQNTAVWIGLGEGSATTPTSTPDIKGTVFGAGAGLRTHGYSALVRGHSSVTIEGNALIEQSVYGGGEMATVGRYNVVNNVAESNISGGVCTVVIGGYAEIGPNDMVMNNTTTGKPDDYGHVFGAGKGIQPYEGFDDDDKPWSKISNGQTEYTEFNEIGSTLPETYATYIRTLALATETDVTIKDHAFVKGSVYGGSENGFVQEDTHVTIQDDCQIGNGYVQMDDEGTYLGTKRSVNRRYTAKEWEKGHLFVTGDPVYYNTEGETPVLNTLTDEETALRNAVGDNYTSSLPECASWPYGRAADEADRYAPYDKDALSTGYYDAGGTNTTAGGRSVGDDGHTFYGNVFGGGSGYYPYKPGRWFKDAGAVYGDTYVTIKGGHILTNVYGGNEMTDVGKYDDNDRLKLISGGNCYVTMIGGTLGVPRTLGQIDKHPVTCYLFGAGKGDQRVFFNKSTNVGNVFVHISDEARIYGSVFGGGEDGHVMKNVTMNIGGGNSTLSTAVAGMFNGVTLSGSKEESKVIYPYIGSYGTSYVDGNVFGAGRGFGGDAYTAGNVAGTVTMNIYGGTMLGSIYGGGRLGSVGYGLFDAKTSTGVDMPGYGEMRLDNTMESQTGTSSSTSEAFPRGYVYMTIGNDDGTGPIIGNKWEYIVPSASSGPKDNGQPTLPADIKNWTEENWMTWKEHNYIPKTEFDTTTGQLTHTKGGNVFAGGMGRFYQLDGHTPISAVDWWKLGNVKSTKLTITGGTIKSNVYGGGELGMVQGGSHTSEDNKSVSTEIIINGGTIGTEVTEKVNNVDVTQYTFGNVFGGGYGSLLEKLTHTSSVTYPKYIAGRVKGSTEVTMTSGAVKASVYGGGEMAAVGESKAMYESTDPVVLGETLTGDNGAPIVANTYVTISGGTIGKEKVGTTYFGGPKMGNVYGGGSGDNNTVRSGHVYGNTNVTISGESTRIYHNVYGGGAYGTVGDFDYNTKEEQVTVNNQTVTVKKVSGIKELKTSGTGVATVTITGGTIGYDGKENGMVFGSSRGDINQPGERDDHTAWVYNANVTIGTAATPASGTPDTEGYVAATPASGPDIKGSVYGSGENGHTFNNTVVTVNGGTIGIDDENDDGFTVTSNGTTYEGAAYPYRGNVYGGGCGTDKYYSNHALETHDGNGQLFNPLAGIVYGTTRVDINGGTVVRNVYGAGAMGSVGRTVTTTNSDNSTTTTYSGGSTTINVSGGVIGVSGTVGDGNVFGAARGDLSATGDYISQVRLTNVTVSGGTVKGNVYGGGELGDVGTIDKSDQTDYNYYWKDKDGNANAHCNNDITGTNNNTGICTVKVTGGTIGTDATTMNADGSFDNGNVYGGGKGSESTWWCEKAIAYSTNVTITAGTVKGSVYGGGEVGRVEDDAKVIIGTENESDTPEINGSVFGAGKGLKTHGYSALVRGNAEVIVQGKSVVGGSVYGGGEIASVGRFHVDKGLPVKPMNGGTCKVLIQDEAQIGSSGTGHNVFGACKGVKSAYDLDNYKNFKSMQTEANGAKGTKGTDWDYYENYPQGYTGHKFVWKYYTTEAAYLSFLKTLALTSNTHVTIDEDATVYGSVFGGGERGVTLGGVDVNITGGTVNEDVYGGGSLADSNTAMWDAKENERVDYVELTELIAETSATGYYTKSGEVYTLLSDATAKVESGTTYYAKYKTNVNLKGGTIVGSVYGGGLGQLAKAAVNYTEEEATTYNTTHNLTEGDADYKTTASVKVAALSAVEAKVYGDVLVNLNETTESDNCVIGSLVNANDPVSKNGNIFGCNNLNGSPQAGVTVHIHKTAQKNNEGNVTAKPDKNKGTYELQAVYGGGNLAAYYPDDATSREKAKANVIIDGCGLTSIGTVYGGGNAASVPATEVVVNGTYEIGQVFGGGNGADDYQIDGKWYDNPGANVGYRSYAYFVKEGETGYSATTHGSGTLADPYKVFEYTSSDGPDKDASTKEKRIANYAYGIDAYGIGKTHVTIYRGTVHEVYGGSNSRGNVYKEARATLEDLSTLPEDRDCPFDVTEAYGGGRNAPMDGDAVLEIGCISGLGKAYGGAANADVNGNVVLNITNGTYGQVFGGNDLGGNITGSITVNIEETGCRPVIIGELYGGGNLAGYSIYGYKKVTETDETTGELVQVWRPRESSTDSPAGVELSIPATIPESPQVNVKSFTSIGNVYGGGYGGPATMVGSPEVNINVFKGKFAETYNGNDNVIGDNARVIGSTWTSNASDEGYDSGYPIPSHAKDAIGAINNVFGGGNAAAVIGTPHVNIGTLTGEVITLASKPIEDSEGNAPTAENWTSYQLVTVEGVDIRGNVYGGGNEADLTGDTEVVIGKNNAVKTYRFTSYGSESGVDAWSSGLAQTTGVIKNGLAEVEILTNGKYVSYVGQKYYVAPNATADGTERTELKNKDGESLSPKLYVAVKPFEQKTYTFTSHSAENGGTQYSTGTAAPTGNFKTFGGQEYMQIVVLTNPNYVSWEGKTFYVSVNAKTDGSETTRLYKADGTAEDVWVSISEQ